MNKIVLFSLMGLITLFLTSCNKVSLKDRDDWLKGNTTDFFIQGQTVSKLNLIWIVDNSGSMKDNQDNLADNFESFIETFVTSKVPYKMGITTTDTSYRGEKGEFQISNLGHPDSYILSSSDETSYVINNFKENIHAGIEYQKILEKNYALDFDDLLLVTIKLFQKDPEILTK